MGDFFDATDAALAATLASAALASAALDGDGAFHSRLGSRLGGRKLAEQVGAGVHDPGAHRLAVAQHRDLLLAVGVEEQRLPSTMCDRGV